MACSIRSPPRNHHPPRTCSVEVRCFSASAPRAVRSAATYDPSAIEEHDGSGAAVDERSGSATRDATPKPSGKEASTRRVPIPHMLEPHRAVRALSCAPSVQRTSCSSAIAILRKATSEIGPARTRRTNSGRSWRIFRRIFSWRSATKSVPP